MISSRFLLSFAVGFFAIALGFFSLLRAPHSRLHRSFGFYAIITAFWFMPGTELFERIFGHHVALQTYRLAQAATPISSYFFLKFIQELSGLWERSVSRWIRRITAAGIVLVAPAVPTTLVIQDYISVPVRSDTVFAIVPGPLYSTFQIAHLVLLAIAIATALHGFLTSQGLKRNQMKFILLGLSIGVVAFAFRLLTKIGLDYPWAYFPLTAAMMMAFAYAIFKYRLLDFGFWMRRMAIYVGVYLPLIVIPFLVFFPFRDWVFPAGTAIRWGLLAVGVLAYAVFFAAAPIVTNALRHLAERRRWSRLEEHLQFVRTSAEALSDEAGLTVGEVVNRLTEVIRELYWSRLRNPPRFVMTAFVDQNDRIALSSFPRHDVDEDILREFFRVVRTVPDELKDPFGSMDIRRLAAERDRMPEDCRRIERYAAVNGIEIICPCFHNRRLLGFILLGAKQSGIFEPEELAALQIAGAHAATAVRKAELLVSNESLRALDRLKSDLIANITHEFKNPTQIIENAVQFLLNEAVKEKPDKDRLAKYIFMVRNNNGRLNLFIRDLLDVAKIESAKVDLKRVRVDLSKRITQAVDLFQQLAAAKGVGIRTALSPAAIDVDPSKIDQIFCNLISNAIKFTDHGRIDVTLVNHTNRILVSVADTGRGIDAAYLPAVFEKFFQGPESPLTKTEGSGLGLTIAKGWTEAHGGRIWAESDGAGKGTTFFVELPLAPAGESKADVV